MGYFILVPLFGVSYITYIILNRLLISHHNATKAKLLVCSPPPSEKNRLPLGIDQLQRALHALDTKSFPPFAIQRTKEVGALTFSTHILGLNGIFTADEHNIQALLATQFPDFDLGQTRRDNVAPFMASGIFSDDGKAWERSRAMMRPQFAREQVSDLAMEERHVQHLMRALDSSLGKGGVEWTEEVDLQPLFFRLTMDSATEFLFGKSVESQVSSFAEDTKGRGDRVAENGVEAFAHAFEVGMAGLATRARFASFCWLVWPRGWKDAIAICHKFIDSIVSEHLKSLQEPKSTRDPEKLETKDRYVFLEALAAETQDPIELRSQLLHVLLAGRDTTASLLGWVFLALARDPTRYKKLRDVIIQDFGTYKDCNPATDITFTKMKACRYLQWVLNETLRIWPLVPWNFRVANKDTTLPRGGGREGKSKIFVPKGTTVDYSVHVLHHRKDIWGSDVEEFVPERWEGRKMSWEYLPFNGGPRICLGQQYALTEASYVITRLLQRFDGIENMDTDPEAKHNMTLTNCSGNGVKVKFHSVRVGN